MEVKNMKVKEIVYTGQITATALQDALEILRLKANYGIVESLTEIDFPSPQQETIEVTKWSKGRIFCETFELRWEKINEDYHTIFTALEGVTPLDGLCKAELPLFFPGKPVEYYCWEEYNPRLSRTINYRCVPGKGRVKLVVLEYRDNYGRLIFWRYTEIKREG